LKIGIVTNYIEDGNPSHITYITNLVNNLRAIDDSNEYWLIHHTKTDDAIYATNREKIVPMPSIKYFQSHIWRYWNLHDAIREMGLDIVHDPSGTSLFARDLPCKKVLTINDLSSLRFPSISRVGMLSWKLLGPSTVKNADKIIVISEFTKKDVMTYLKVPEEKIRVIYDGNNEFFNPVNIVENSETYLKYNIEFPYILFTGVLQPRKNVPTLIKAYKILKNRGVKHKLVLVGKKGWQYEEIFNTIDKLDLREDVIFTGYVPEEYLPAIYSGADVFAFPSLFEGFGLPPLEAMACGTPVITSNTSSLPEIVDEAGIMVNPYDVENLAEAMFMVITNEKLRKDMTSKGLQRAKLFTWKKCAEDTLEVYKEVMKIK
jgi:Glycosyltransferase